MSSPLISSLHWQHALVHHCSSPEICISCHFTNCSSIHKQIAAYSSVIYTEQQHSLRCYVDKRWNKHQKLQDDLLQSTLRILMLLFHQWSILRLLAAGHFVLWRGAGYCRCPPEKKDAYVMLTFPPTKKGCLRHDDVQWKRSSPNSRHQSTQYVGVCSYVGTYVHTPNYYHMVGT